MPSSSSDSHAHVCSPSITPSTSHDQRSSISKASRLFDKLKAGSSSSKRRQEPDANPSTVPAVRRSSSSGGGASPFSLAQRLRVLLDAHPVNSPAPSFQPLPTPETSSPPSVPGSFQQHGEQFPASPIQAGSTPLARPSNLSPVSPLSSSMAYFSAPSSPTDAEIVALLSSPISMAGSLPGQDFLPVPDSLHTPPIAGPSTLPDPALTPPPLSPARYQSVFNFLDRIGSPKARARRLSRVTDRDRRESLNGYSASPRVWPGSPAMSSISSVLASGSATAAYGSDGMRDIEEEESTEDDDDDDTSIMMYSPLMPTSTSLVSIANTEISVVAVEEEPSDEEGTEPVQNNPPPVPDPQPQPTETRSGWSWSNLWSFSWFSSSNQGQASASASTPNPSTTEPQAATTRSQRSIVQPRPTSTQVRLRRRRVWVPSRTQLSLETMWWGYRIYIPPPVLDALDSTSVETSRRAALLTAALTWFFTNFPVNVLPITVRPVIIILQGLVPYLGYLGGILSWSWGSVKSYDEGYGIILTATWLMPIALIPSTWVPPPSEWPGSPFSTTSATFSPNTSQSTPTLSTMSPTQTTPTLSTLSPTMSQSTSMPGFSSPTISESTVTPTPMLSTSLPSSPRSPTISLPLQLEQIQELRERAQQRQPFPTHSPASLPLPPRSTAPPSLVEQHYSQELPGQMQRQEQLYPIYSPYGYTTMLSPLPQLSSSFPSPTQNGSPYPYAYGHPFPTTSQTPPIMAMSMMSPIPSNGGIVYSPALSTLPVVSASYSSSSSTPAPVMTLPITSTPVSSIRRRGKRRENPTSSVDDSVHAPRMTTVPLPDDG